jgi:hypothetical protein
LREACPDAEPARCRVIEAGRAATSIAGLLFRLGAGLPCVVIGGGSLYSSWRAKFRAPRRLPMMHAPLHRPPRRPASPRR